MGRLIDSYQAIDIIDEWLDSVGTVMVGKGLSSYGELIGCIEDTPTLTPPNEWVNRDECLPEWKADVLVRYANGKIDISWVDSVGAFQFECLYGRVTHWMPLPAPPDHHPPEGEA